MALLERAYRPRPEQADVEQVPEGAFCLAFNPADRRQMAPAGGWLGRVVLLLISEARQALMQGCGHGPCALLPRRTAGEALTAGLSHAIMARHRFGSGLTGIAEGTPRVGRDGLQPRNLPVDKSPVLKLAGLGVGPPVQHC